MRKYRHLIFDLDHTLWDFNRNSKETIYYLFEKHHLAVRLNCSRKEYFKIYTDTTNALWRAYDKKEISKQTLRLKRLELVFQHFKKNDHSLQSLLERDYRQICPRSQHLIKGAKYLLKQLAPNYKLYLLTNGFKEIQLTKIKTTQIEHFFEEIITSEDSESCKPHKEAFDFLHQKINDDKNSCLMIGDNDESDIKGADEFGYDTVFFSPTNEESSRATYTINKLSDLQKLV